MNVVFQRLETPESLEAVRTIAKDIWPKTFASILSADQIAYMMKMMYAPEVMEKEFAAGYIFELVVIDGVPGGYIVCSPCDEDPQHILKLHKAYLLQEYHSKGIGQLMLDRALTLAAEGGFECVHLNVNKQNERAIRAYQRNGFTLLRAEKNPIGCGYYMDDYVFFKEARCLAGKN